MTILNFIEFFYVSISINTNTHTLKNTIVEVKIKFTICIAIVEQGSIRSEINNNKNKTHCG